MLIVKINVLLLLYKLAKGIGLEFLQTSFSVLSFIEHNKFKLWNWNLELIIKEKLNF